MPNSFAFAFAFYECECSVELNLVVAFAFALVTKQALTQLAKKGQGDTIAAEKGITFVY